MLAVKLHDIGEGMTEGEVVQYLVQVGDWVETDQPLVEIQTDKMIAEISSPCAGHVKEIIIEIGETVQVGTSLLYIESSNKEVEKQQQQPEEDISKREANMTSVVNFHRVLATPYTRKLARENNINIEDVPRADASGRVTEADVQQFIKYGEVNHSIVPEVQEKVLVESVHDVIPFMGIRKKIAEKMTKSLYTIPHVTHFDEVNMTNLFRIRSEMKASGESVSVTAFFIKALVVALKDYPIFNAELDEANDRILLKKSYHIGFATNTENGLLVPVVHNADEKSMKSIHKVVKDLSERAIAGKLQPFEMKNSTFTMSNVGPLGSTGATPIINYPETAIIAFHKTKRQPIFNDLDEIIVGHIMTFSMAFDHRVADGATAVAFTNRFASLIEQPHKLMMEMI
ncbi:dihydrolipoamide acetyltransferase family protein [Sporosarcina sp. FA9]|uniref:dihydrolipoamide acetyltransferase family protein n=1 Tax=Sporosarcina sp. FA9 TaxID=3413030 RepID=UPI003F65B5A4